MDADELEGLLEFTAARVRFGLDIADLEAMLKFCLSNETEMARWSLDSTAEATERTSSLASETTLLVGSLKI